MLIFILNYNSVIDVQEKKGWDMKAKDFVYMLCFTVVNICTFSYCKSNDLGKDYAIFTSVGIGGGYTRTLEDDADGLYGTVGKVDIFLATMDDYVVGVNSHLQCLSSDTYDVHFEVGSDLKDSGDYPLIRNAGIRLLSEFFCISIGRASLKNNKMLGFCLFAGGEVKKFSNLREALIATEKGSALINQILSYIFFSGIQARYANQCNSGALFSLDFKGGVVFYGENDYFIKINNSPSAFADDHDYLSVAKTENNIGPVISIDINYITSNLRSCCGSRLGFYAHARCVASDEECRQDVLGLSILELDSVSKPTSATKKDISAWNRAKIKKDVEFENSISRNVVLSAGVMLIHVSI